MKFLVFIFLALAAAVLIIGMIIGLAFKLIGFAVAALLVVAGVTWVMRKLGRPTDVDRNSLTR
jgi:membrane protein implicated in regulation of membrane protease activity